MGKFFNGKVKKSRESLVKAILIILGILAVFIIVLLVIKLNAKRNQPQMLIKDKVVVEVNSKLPEKTDYFQKIKKIKENDITIDDSQINISEIGEYSAIINVKGYNTFNTIVSVIDSTAPDLKLQNLTINSGESYSLEDFIINCEDNSNKGCNISYAYDVQDQDGNIIDFSKYTHDGTYVIQIQASDNSGNKTDNLKTTLTIGNKQNNGEEKPPKDEPVETECKYGSLETDVKYPIAVIVADNVNNCPLDRNLWDDDNVQKKVDELYKEDYDRLKEQMTPILNTQYPKGAKLFVYPHYVAVWNKELTGLVGYAIYVKVYVADSSYSDAMEKDENLKIEYYINSDKTRKYYTNEFKLS